MQLKSNQGFLENENFSTYVSVGIVLLLFLMMEVTYQIIFESTVMVLSHFFYFPVIIISFLYPRRGVLISTFIAIFYLVIIYGFVYPDFYGIVSATMQFYVYVSVSVIVSIISDRVKSDRAKFRSIFDYSESGVCVIDSDTGRILERNKKFMDILKNWGFSESEESVVALCGNDEKCREFLTTLNFEGSLENQEMKIHSDKNTVNYTLISASKVPNDTIVMSFTDITERKLDAERIMELNRSQKEANKEANMYIDILTHDINNANTAAQGFAELLYETVSDDDRPYFDKMLVGIKQSSNIIDKVIKIRDIHNKKEPPVPYSLDIAVCAAEERLSFKVNYGSCDIMVQGGNFLDDLFFYLFENSIAYGGKDVKIDVLAEDKGEFYEISVTDNGPGIEDSRKKNLFLRFQPEGNSRKGRGLGLAVCWLIANRYGGDISAQDAVAGNSKDGLKIVLKLRKA